MELPLWLSKGLYDRKRRVLSVELPKVYREGWRTVFSADPNVVDLHKMGPYYYGLGSQMLHFDSPENTEIGQTLLQVRNRNFPQLVCWVFQVSTPGMKEFWKLRYNNTFRQFLHTVDAVISFSPLCFHIQLLWLCVFKAIFRPGSQYNNQISLFVSSKKFCVIAQTRSPLKRQIVPIEISL